MARLNFVELPARDLASAKTFYQDVFGWSLSDFGPTYACTLTGEVDLGLQGDMGEGAPAAPLAVVVVDDLEAAQAAVEKAGGRVVKAIFSFPGGRRFHFSDQNGMELAVLQEG